MDLPVFSRSYKFMRLFLTLFLILSPVNRVYKWLQRDDLFSEFCCISIYIVYF